MNKNVSKMHVLLAFLCVLQLFAFQQNVAKSSGKDARKSAPEHVYTLEVHSAHDYVVSNVTLLSHNSSATFSFSSNPSENLSRLQKMSASEIAEVLDVTLEDAARIHSRLPTILKWEELMGIADLSLDARYRLYHLVAGHPF